MEILEALFTRRSIRKFNMGEMPDEDLHKILKAAMHAPNSGNQQLWQFVVVRERDQIEKIIESYPYAKMLRDTPVAVIVCMDPEREKWELRWQMDCANATYSILLAAHGLGYGGLWLEIYPIEERIKMIQESFDMPDGVIPLAVVGIGHPAEEKPLVDRYDESIVHYDRW